MTQHEIPADQILSHILERLDGMEADLSKIKKSLVGDLDDHGKPVIGLMERIRWAEDQIRSSNKSRIVIITVVCGLFVRAVWGLIVKGP